MKLNATTMTDEELFAMAHELAQIQRPNWHARSDVRKGPKAPRPETAMGVTDEQWASRQAGRYTKARKRLERFINEISAVLVARTPGGRS